MRASTAEQQASATRIHGLASDCLTQINGMDGDVSHMQAVWTGAGATAFVVGSTDIHLELGKAQVTMADVAHKTSKSGVGYNMTDAGSAQLLGNTGL